MNCGRMWFWCETSFLKKYGLGSKRLYFNLFCRPLVGLVVRVRSRLISVPAARSYGDMIVEHYNKNIEIMYIHHATHVLVFTPGN